MELKYLIGFVERYLFLCAPVHAAPLKGSSQINARRSNLHIEWTKFAVAVFEHRKLPYTVGKEIFSSTIVKFDILMFSDFPIRIADHIVF